MSAVSYPAAPRAWAHVQAPSSRVPIGSRARLQRWKFNPLISAARDGMHGIAAQYALRNIVPSLAIRSRFGVATRPCDS
jgi:hypothetical protein